MAFQAARLRLARALRQRERRAALAPGGGKGRVEESGWGPELDPSMSSSPGVDSGSGGSSWERSVWDKQRGEGGESGAACAPGDNRPHTPSYSTTHTFPGARAGRKMVPAHCDAASRRGEAAAPVV